MSTTTSCCGSKFSDLLRYLHEAKNFKLIDTGAASYNGIKFKWLIETHQHEVGNIQMQQYAFVTFKEGKTFILTVNTFSSVFDTVKSLFDKIAGSFTLLD